MSRLDVKSVYRSVLDRLFDVSPYILVDVCAVLYNTHALREDFGEFFPSAEVDQNEVKVLTFVLSRILNRESGWHKLFAKIVKRVERYIEGTRYPEMSEEELVREFEKDLPVGLLGYGITPELLIFYFIACRRAFHHPKLPFLIEQYRKVSEKAHAFAQEVGKTAFPAVKLEGELRGSLVENELNLFIKGEFRPQDESYLSELASKYMGTYDPSSRTMTVPAGLVAFLHAKLSLLVQWEKLLEDQEKALDSFAVSASRILRSAKRVFEENERLAGELEALKKRLRELEEENEALKRELSARDVSNLEQELSRLRLELQKASKYISHLESKLADFEEEERIKEEIQEDVEIPAARPVLRKVEIKPFSRIVVSGGRYNSKDREEIEKLLDQIGSSVAFVPAPETIRRQDVFKAADLIFFDTSYHAHSLYQKVLSLNRSVVLVRGKADLKELIRSSLPFSS